MSYVPPHLRRKEKKVEMPKIVESEFPEFVAGQRLVHDNRPSFISKVKEETKNINIPERDISAVPRHHFTLSKPNPETKYEEPQPQPAKLNDGWQTVERKVRIKKDKVQEALDNEDGEVEEDSAWDEQPEEYETYWDERKH